IAHASCPWIAAMASRAEVVEVMRPSVVAGCGAARPDIDAWIGLERRSVRTTDTVPDARHAGPMRRIALVVATVGLLLGIGTVARAATAPSAPLNVVAHATAEDAITVWWSAPKIG